MKWFQSPASERAIEKPGLQNGNIFYSSLPSWGQLEKYLVFLENLCHLKTMWVLFCFCREGHGMRILKQILRCKVKPRITLRKHTSESRQWNAHGRAMAIYLPGPQRLPGTTHSSTLAAVRKNTLHGGSPESSVRVPKCLSQQSAFKEIGLWIGSIS